MDGFYFNDLRLPFCIVSPAAVTLAATDKALHLAAVHPPLGANYWSPTKMVRIEVTGVCTSVATPGNLSLALYWGTGADANGTILAQMTATAWGANQTAMTWRAWFDVECRTIGATGSLLAFGAFRVTETAIAAEVQIPGTAVAAVTVDTTANNVLSIQAKRSGSTAETMQIISYKFFALN